MSVTPEATGVRPFRIEVPEEQLAALRIRLGATRWPSTELVADRSQGVQLATLQALARYWTEEHDWRKAEAKLNALPQFMAEIDGVEIHFIHVKSRHENALPLIMTHGWPGSVIELLEVVGPLTDPTAHGGTPEDAFDLVLPSLPGYGFSGEPAELGWNAGRVAQAWGRLMARLGYTRPSCSPPRFAPRSGHSASSQRPRVHPRRPSPSPRSACVCGRRRGRCGHPGPRVGDRGRVAGVSVEDRVCPLAHDRYSARNQTDVLGRLVRGELADGQADAAVDPWVPSVIVRALGHFWRRPVESNDQSSPR